MSNQFINKKITFLTDHISELIVDFNKSDTTAARTRKDFFLKKKYLGSKDRKCVTGVFYFYLRHHSYASQFSTQKLLYLSYNFDNVVSIALNKLLKTIDINTYLERTYDLSNSILDEFDNLTSKSFFPQNFIENIKIEDSELESLCDSLNKEATTDIRIIKNNSLVKNDLDNLNAEYSKNIVPNCYKIKGNVNLDNTRSYREGFFEIQDEGSQLIAYALAPKQGDLILDYCAGGGGKSLHISHLAADKARIIATDISNNRLNETKRRISKLGIKSISVKPIDEVNEDITQYDKILIDAPCTGSGTVRRAPDIRINSNNETIEKYHKLQLEILDNVSDKLKPDGMLIYVTCSLFSKENDDTIDKFLSKHPEYTSVSSLESIASYGIDTNRFSDMRYGIQTYTHRTDTDSFYISTLKKMNQ